MCIKRICVLFIAIITIILTASATYARTYANFSQRLCNSQGYYCVRVRSGQSWFSMFPDDHDRGIVMRVNRMNTHVYPGQIIAVPYHLENADVMDFSPFPAHMNTNGEKVIVIDPAVLAWGAYDAQGTLLRWGPASSGRSYCRDIDQACQTSAGSFRIFSLGDVECYSRKFPVPDGGAPMPYCMYFHNGQALHGEPNGLPGHNASHGCVRLYVNDAEWLRYEFVSGANSGSGYRGTKVIVRPY